MKLPNGHIAIVPIEKLRDYCLNSEHDVGSHKAYVFVSVLGLTKNEAEFLQQRLLDVAHFYEAVATKRDSYGQRYIIDFELTTHRGSAIVRSTWIILANENFPRLTSCYIL
jgi:hypothetical protein